MCKAIISKGMTDNFVITNIILSMTKEFTFSSICEEIRKSRNVHENTIKASITRLRENDYLEENGSYYNVIDQNKSTRWNIF